MNIRYSFTICRTTNCRTVPEPGYADRGPCVRHEQDARTAIDALPDDHTNLLPLVWDKTKRGNAPTGVFGPHDECDWNIDALAGEIAYAAVQWGEIVADRARLSTPGDVRAACQVLGAHFLALIATPECTVVGYDRTIGYLDGLDAAIWLTSLHRRAVAYIGVTTRTRRLPGVCPACNSPTLDHNDGADLVRCARCRKVWTWKEYDLHVELTTWGSVA